MSEATIKGTTFTLGEVSFEIDRTDPHKTLQAINNLKTGDLQKMASAVGLPIEPFDKTLVRPVLLGVLQNAWYKEIKGAIPASCVSGQANRVSRYKQQVEELKNAASEDLVAAAKKTKKASTSAPKAVFRVVLDSAQEKVYAAKSDQQGLIVNAFVKAKAVSSNKEHKGLSVAEVAELVQDCSCCRAKKPSQTNTAFHINNWKNDGLLKVTNQADLPEPKSKKALAPEGTKQEEAAKPKETAKKK